MEIEPEQEEEGELSMIVEIKTPQSFVPGRPYQGIVYLYIPRYLLPR
jgi:hypothetical protein